jgi:hypothetical protein
LHKTAGHNSKFGGLETSNELQKIHSLVQVEIGVAQVRQQENVDKLDNLTPVYQVGDTIWLNAQNIITHCPSFKLDYKCLSLFPILALVGKFACRLQLP